MNMFKVHIPGLGHGWSAAEIIQEKERWFVLNYVNDTILDFDRLEQAVAHIKWSYKAWGEVVVKSAL